VYFSLGGFCGLLALVTSMGWSSREPASRVHRCRVWILVAALLTVLLGWPLERMVAHENAKRNDAIDHLLTSDEPTGEVVEAASAAKKSFVMWHTFSLGLSLVGVVLVTIGMGLAARLPGYDASGPT
jgi:hypothetical protein